MITKGLLLFAIASLSLTQGYGRKSKNGGDILDSYSYEIKTIDRELIDQPLCNLFTPYYRTVSNVSCYHYEECSNGGFSTGKCPWLQKFNPATSSCRLFGADCNGKPAPIPNPWPTFDCKGRPNFKTTSPWGCKYYLECSGGSLKVGECSWIWPKFQQSTQECRNAFISCDDRVFPVPPVSTTPSPTTPTVEPSTVSRSTGKGTSPTGEPPFETTTNRPKTTPEVLLTTTESVKSSTEVFPFTITSSHSKETTTDGGGDLPTFPQTGSTREQRTTKGGGDMPTLNSDDENYGESDHWPTWDTLSINV